MYEIDSRFSMIKNFWLRRQVVISILAVLIVGLVSYSNIFSAPFVFDDYPSIIANRAMQLMNWSELWRHYSTRFLPYVTLSLNYAWGGLEPVGYHVVNVVIHVTTSISVFWLTYRLAQFRMAQRIYRVGKLVLSNQLLLALSVSLLFVSHPLQTQAVTYTTQRITSLAVVFYILALALYIEGRYRRQWIWLGGAWLATVAAMFSKEISFTLPLGLILLEWGVIEASWHNLKGRVFRLLPFLLTLLIIPVVLVSVRTSLIRVATSDDGGVVSSLDRLNFSRLAADDPELPRWHYLLTQINVVRSYVQLLVVPVGQNLDHDYPVSKTLIDSLTLASLTLLLGLLGLALVLWKKKRLVSIGILFFFLALSVESSVVPIRDVIFEHRLYLPSFGFFLAVGAAWLAGLDRVYKSKKSFFYILLLLGVIVIGTLTVATYRRNHVWQSELSLWQDVVAKSPRKPRGYTGLALAYSNNGQYDAAERALHTAMALDPERHGVHDNLGTIYRQQGRWEEAETQFRREIELNPRSGSAHNNLAGVFVYHHDWSKALEELTITLSLRPDEPSVWVNTALVYEQLGQKDKAIEAYQKAVTLDPEYDVPQRALRRLQSGNER